MLILHAAHSIVSDPQKPIKFRLINVANEKPFRFEVDGHRLKVLSSDGYPFKSVIIDQLFIGLAERYDIELIRIDNTLEHFRIWVRSGAELSVDFTKNDEIQNQYTLAILSYSSGTLPDEIPTLMSNSDPFLVLNCPFLSYPVGWNKTCLYLEDLENSLQVPTGIIADDQSKILRHFLNIRMQNGMNAINGKSLKLPIYPPFMFPNDPNYVITPCDSDCGKSQICRCTHIVEIPLGSVVELTVYSMDPRLDVLSSGDEYSLHLHGQHFYVIKHGYPQTNPASGMAEARNIELDCDGYHCNDAGWTNSSWYVALPDANLKVTCVMSTTDCWNQVPQGTHNPSFRIKKIQKEKLQITTIR